MGLRLCGVGLTWAVALAAGGLSVLVMIPRALAFGVIASPVDFLRLDFGVSMLAAPFLALLAVISFAVGLWSLRRGRPADIVLIGFFALAMLSVFIAQSVAAFFLAWEAMSLVSAFLVAAHHERREVRRAALTYLIIAQGGALLHLGRALCVLRGRQPVARPFLHH